MTRRGWLFVAILSASVAMVANHVVQYHGGHWGNLVLSYILLSGIWTALGKAGVK